ncbi:acyl transferase [Flavihumibacter sp. CACIAM 22H1]|uniref:LuxE/PaaK family acyltransferase n=1 Tax=Flavihumibacter sp. CACIAM 22H1 TaxID=1812911 RepID=UPI0007A86424|nr:acyl transferase [Flavihumibacter sp. CACIAM 22H1]KYP13316.1 MAG: acyl transferase [Flavihumibacter sp. CACIAM 22H1]
MRSELIHKIFSTPASQQEPLILEIFQFQYQNNPVYKRFCDAIGRSPASVSRLNELPFLPIRFFKSTEVKTGQFEPELWFESSGTTGQVNSRHYIRNLALYRESFTRCFHQFYGAPEDWCILGLLPAYLERQHSSLVRMVKELIELSGHPAGGFYLYNHEQLQQTLVALQEKGQKTLLFGVSFALLDFAETYSIPLPTTTIIETGGMKGRRQEITRQALHEKLAASFPGCQIHSEYGMTELLSQAYCGDDGLFYCPPWMKILLREEDDPFHILPLPGAGKNNKALTINGIINVIDLANLDSCCFIATDDMGKIYPDGGFEVVGRVDNSDIRGCSLLTI